MIPRRLARELLARAPLADGLFRRLVWSRVHFPEREMRFLASLPRGSLDIAVDVGAARGSYAWILARKSRQVFAFEPGAEHFRQLERLTLGTCVTATRAAVGELDGESEFFTPGDDEQGRHAATLSRDNPAARATGVRVERVRTVTLDRFLAPHLSPGRSVDVIKIDVEGYELPVLLGARAVIEAHHPLVICEIEARHNPSYQRVFDWFAAAQYTCWVNRGRGYVQFEGGPLEPHQTEAARAFRLGDAYHPRANAYLNNFVFQHPASRVTVVR